MEFRLGRLSYCLLVVGRKGCPADHVCVGAAIGFV